MLNIADCLVETHDLSLVGLAGLICLASAWTTFRLLPIMLSENTGTNAIVWLILTAAVAGGGVWATHFVGMLAFQPPIEVGYEVWTTGLSLLVGILFTTFAFGVVLVFPRGRIGPLAAGLALGLSTAAMHYTGSAGMRVAGDIVWDPRLILLSACFSALLASPALFLACKRDRRLRRLGVMLFALSIVALHFTGTAAITLVPDPSRALPRALLSGVALGYAIGTVSLLILGCAIASWIVESQTRRDHERRLKFMARHDPLTSLPNRALLEEIAARELSGPDAGASPAAILCLDLDGFKEVNDLFGHAAGDQILVEVAVRLQRLLGEQCVAARLGGDEFAILASGLGPKKSPAVAAQAVLDALAAPFNVDGNYVDIGCSVGIAVFPDDGTTYPVLLAKADTALGRAKADGKGVFRFFERHMDEVLRERRELARDLRSALGTEQLRLEYQPQVDVRSGRVHGFEALLRWDHPRKGPIPATIFVPIAEETGLILRTGEWALREACRDAAAWEEPLSLAVNLSPAQFRQTGLAELIFFILKETGLPPERLELEITEGLLLENPTRAVQVLERLKGRGVRIVMDEFGTGYSSLSALQMFPFDKIKIDRSFTTQIGRDRKATAIVKALVGLGESLDITVVAEGVHAATQLAFLREHRCPEAQGILCGEPRPMSGYLDAVSPRCSRPNNVHTLRLA